MRLSVAMLLCALLIPARASAQLVKLEISPATTYLTQPLDQNGVPDYLAAIESRLSAGVTADNNFWTLVWPALGNAEHSSPEYLRAVERKLNVQIPEQGLYRELWVRENPEQNMALHKQLDAALQQPWKRAEQPAISNWLDQNSEFLSVVERACRRSHTYSPLVSSGEGSSLVYVLLAHVQRSRDICRMLICRSMLRMGEGDTEAAWQDLLTSYRLAGQVEQGYSLIERLVGIAIRSMTASAVATWMNHAGLSADELAAHREELVPLLDIPSFAGCVDEGERFMVLQLAIALSDGTFPSQDFESTFFLQAVLSTGNETRTESPQESELIKQLGRSRGPLMRYLLTCSDINATLRTLNENYDLLADAIRQPTHPQRVAALSALSVTIDDDARIANSGVRLLEEFVFATDEDLKTLPGRVLLGTMAPALTNIAEAYTRGEARSATLIAAFRIAEEIQRTGKVPMNFNEISAELPRDPYTEQPLHLRVTPGEVLIYSYGRNSRNDAGKSFGEGEGTDDVGVTLLVP